MWILLEGTQGTCWLYQVNCMLILCVKPKTHTSIMLLCGCSVEMHLRHSIPSLPLILTEGCCCWESILSASDPCPPTTVINVQRGEISVPGFSVIFTILGQIYQPQTRCSSVLPSCSCNNINFITPWYMGGYSNYNVLVLLSVLPCFFDLRVTLTIIHESRGVVKNMEGLRLTSDGCSMNVGGENKLCRWNVSLYSTCPPNVQIHHCQ